MQFFLPRLARYTTHLKNFSTGFRPMPYLKLIVINVTCNETFAVNLKYDGNSISAVDSICQFMRKPATVQLTLSDGMIAILYLLNTACTTEWEREASIRFTIRENRDVQVLRRKYGTAGK